MARQVFPEAEGQRRLLVDSNLLVLYVVGSVNIKRVPQFKRTAKYTADDYRLLSGFMDQFPEVWVVPQVTAEVSNLTDLSGRKRALAFPDAEADRFNLTQSQRYALVFCWS